MSIERIGVVGAGQMGAGIAQVLVTAGYEVVLIDIDQKMIDTALDKICKNLEISVEKKRFKKTEMKKILGRINTSSSKLVSGSRLYECNLIIEAIIEDLDAKLELFKQLSENCYPDTIFASNTTSISITKLASVVKHPDRFIGMHFMSPVPAMRLVEIIRGHMTSNMTVETIIQIVFKLGKKPVECNDFPGFISSRLIMTLINEAMFCSMEGVGDRANIDQAMELGMNHPVGPLRLADLIGLDTCLNSMRVMQEGLGDKYRPCPLLVKMVDAGLLGKKSGQGFYKYPK